MSAVAAAASYRRPHQVNDQQMSRSLQQPLQLEISRKTAKTVPLKLSKCLDKIHFIITPNSSLDSAFIAVQDSIILVTVGNQLSRTFDTEHGGTLSPCTDF